MSSCSAVTWWGAANSAASSVCSFPRFLPTTVTVLYRTTGNRGNKPPRRQHTAQRNPAALRHSSAVTDRASCSGVNAEGPQFDFQIRRTFVSSVLPGEYLHSALKAATTASSQILSYSAFTIITLSDPLFHNPHSHKQPVTYFSSADISSTKVCFNPLNI